MALVGVAPAAMQPIALALTGPSSRGLITALAIVLGMAAAKLFLTRYASR